MVMVPLGMRIKPGMQVNIYPKDLWEAASPEQRRLEESDDSRLRSLKLAFTLCHAAGCVAEIEATQEILSSLETSGGIMVRTADEAGASADFSVSLEGFAQAFAGPPTNPQTPRSPPSNPQVPRSPPVDPREMRESEGQRFIRRMPAEIIERARPD